MHVYATTSLHNFFLCGRLPCIAPKRNGPPFRLAAEVGSTGTEDCARHRGPRNHTQHTILHIHDTKQRTHKLTTTTSRLLPHKRVPSVASSYVAAHISRCFGPRAKSSCVRQGWSPALISVFASQTCPPSHEVYVQDSAPPNKTPDSSYAKSVRVSLRRRFRPYPGYTNWDRCEASTLPSAGDFHPGINTRPPPPAVH